MHMPIVCLLQLSDFLCNTLCTVDSETLAPPAAIAQGVHEQLTDVRDELSRMQARQDAQQELWKELEALTGIIIPRR
jgi:SUMO ligase MMS21 Smc5/6 complex component